MCRSDKESNLFLGSILYPISFWSKSRNSDWIPVCLLGQNAIAHPLRLENSYQPKFTIEKARSILVVEVERPHLVVGIIAGKTYGTNPFGLHQSNIYGGSRWSLAELSEHWLRI